jgi:gluconolactonase
MQAAMGATEMTLRQITDGLVFAEGPVPLPTGDVLVVEVMAGRLTRVGADGSKSLVGETGGGPNGAAIGPDGRCFICNNGGFGPSVSSDCLLPSEAPLSREPGSIQAVDLKTGSVETLYTHSAKTPFWGPNDLVFDGHGGFWFTDYGRDRQRARTRGAVYYAQADGSSIDEALYPMESPNGVGLSPDGSTLYIAETYTGHLWRFRLSAPGVIDPAGGHSPNGGSIVGRAGPGEFLDSLAVDSEGYICCGSPGRGAILIFPPEGGSPERIEMPDFLTTNIAFGGPDLRTAYVTLGSSGRLMAMDWPRPGLRLCHL